MNRRLSLKTLLTVTLGVIGSGILLSPTPVSAQGVPVRPLDEVLVGLSRTTGEQEGMMWRVGLSPIADAQEDVKGRIEATIGRVIEEVPALGVYRVKLRPGLSVPHAIADARRIAGVSYAEPNYTLVAFDTTTDTYYTTHQWAPQKVGAELAWSQWNPKASTVIAIVDTGVNLSHPDLVNKLYRDSSGKVVGYDFINKDADPTDDNGHGTHCAGIAAAQANNSAGIAGIAGWTSDSLISDTTSTKIMPIKVLGSGGTGALSVIASGITFAADKGAKVISLSLGSTIGTTTLANAVAYAWNKGCVIVAAAGNYGSSDKCYPAAYPNVISVAATDRNDTLAYFSNYGTWVNCAAPGVDIYSTYRSSYGWMSGTSMATPLVAGQVALLASQAPELTNVVLRDAVLQNVDPYNPYSGRTISGGRVNIAKALNAVINLPAAPSNLGTSAISKNQVSLKWTDTASNEQGFVVERSTDNKNFTVLATLGANTTGYASGGLAASTTYYYRVRAFNAYGSSVYSNTLSAKTLRR